MKFSHIYTLYKKEAFVCILFMLFLLLFLLSGCYSPHKARRHIIKAQSVYPIVTAELCGSFYEPIQFVRDSIIYVQGEVISMPADTIVIDCDTVRKNIYEQKIVKFAPPKISFRVDTIYRTKEVQVINKAQQIAIQKELEDLKISVVQKATTLNILWWACGILSLYTIARWLVKYFTRFTLP